ncbi:MAG: hypothetical protein JXQ81_09855 [Desulfuromonadales bacterium]|nr:hypothetical protein [Desulfuromonadales bacterium]MBN2792798.1 hypothetical protein [Desulfuromonadales bacterium]
MAFDVSILLTWILFLALFPMAFFWLRRAWRIFIKKNYSEVATKKGLPPANPKKWAPVVGLLNLICGAVATWIILGILLWGFAGINLFGGVPDFKTWNAYGGMTIVGKIMADIIIRFQAHPITFGRKKNTASE